MIHLSKGPATNLTDDQVKEIRSSKYHNVLDANNNVIHKKVRVGITHNNVPIVMNARSRRRGRLLDSIASYIDPIAVKSKYDTRYAFVTKNFSYLADSGLWKDIKSNLGKELVQFDNIYTTSGIDKTVADKLGFKIQEPESSDKIISVTGSMPKYERPYYLALINKLWEDNVDLANKQDSIHWKGDYDYTYSIGYDDNGKPTKGRFSKEYKGCGNGHYYILVDKTHASFHEID
jgi:hypothetical protein